MTRILLTLLFLIPSVALAGGTRQKVDVDNEVVVGVIDETVSSAIAPSGNECWSALAFQSKTFGIAWGGGVDRCIEQSLAWALWVMGEKEKARQILLWQFADVQRKHKPKLICRRPVEEHCYTATASPEGIHQR